MVLVCRLQSTSLVMVRVSIVVEDNLAIDPRKVCTVMITIHLKSEGSLKQRAHDRCAKENLLKHRDTPILRYRVSHGPFVPEQSINGGLW